MVYSAARPCKWGYLRSIEKPLFAISPYNKILDKKVKVIIRIKETISPRQSVSLIDLSKFYSLSNVPWNIWRTEMTSWRDDWWIALKSNYWNRNGVMRNKAGSMTYNNSYILEHLKRYDLEKLKWHGCSKQKIFLGSWARKQAEKNIKVSSLFSSCVAARTGRSG